MEGNSNRTISYLEGGEITNNVVKRLMDAGFRTAAQIADTKNSELLKLDGLTEDMVKKLKDKVNMLLNQGVQIALELDGVRCQSRKISTGSSALDNLLGGGIQFGSITEIFGHSETYASEFCLTVTVKCQLSPENGGVLGKVLFIGTEDVNPFGRLLEISNKYKLNENQIHSNVKYESIINCSRLQSVLTEYRKNTEKSAYDLLIVHRGIHVIINEYPHSTHEKERQEEIYKFMLKLSKLAEQKNIAVVITNEVYLDTYQSELSSQVSYKTYSGKAVANFSKTRLFLEEIDGNSKIVCKLYKPSSDVGVSARFAITKFGIEDVCEEIESRVEDQSLQDDALTKQHYLVTLARDARDSIEDIITNLLKDLKEKMGGDITNLLPAIKKYMDLIKKKYAEISKKEIEMRIKEANTKFKMKTSEWEQQALIRDKEIRDKVEEAEKMLEDAANQKAEAEALKKQAEDILYKNQQSTEEQLSKIKNLLQELQRFSTDFTEKLNGLQGATTQGIHNDNLDSSTVQSINNGVGCVENDNFTVAAVQINLFDLASNVVRQLKDSSSLLGKNVGYKRKLSSTKKNIKKCKSLYGESIETPSKIEEDKKTKNEDENEVNNIMQEKQLIQNFLETNSSCNLHDITMKMVETLVDLQLRSYLDVSSGHYTCPVHFDHEDNKNEDCPCPSKNKADVIDHFYSYALSIVQEKGEEKDKKNILYNLQKIAVKTVEEFVDNELIANHNDDLSQYSCPLHVERQLKENEKCPCPTKTKRTVKDHFYKYAVKISCTHCGKEYNSIHGFNNHTKRFHVAVKKDKEE